MWRSLAVLTALGAASFAGEFKDSTWGYRVKVPNGWRRAALPTTELFIASKHLGKRELESNRGNNWVLERPEMWIIGFPKGRAGGHKDYPSYIRAQPEFLKWDRHKWADPKSMEIDGAKVTLYEITPVDAEKDAEARHVVAMVYHFDDVELVVQFKIIEQYYGEFKASFFSAMKSLRRIKRTGAFPGTGKEKGGGVDLTKLSPEERDRKLKEQVEQHIRKEIAALQEGWSNKRSKSFVVLTNANDKFVRKAIAHAEAVRGHFEKFLGQKSKRYEPPTLLRIFASDDERTAYKKAAGDGASGPVREILVVSGHGYVEDNEFQAVNKAVLNAWLDARHPLLRDMIPGWLTVVLEKYADMLRTKRGRIGYAKDDYDRDTIRLAIKRDEYTNLGVFLGEGIKRSNLEGKELPSDQRGLQLRSFGFWILTKGNRAKYKNLIRKYLAALEKNVRDVEEGAIRQAQADKKSGAEGAWRAWALAETKGKRDQILQKTFEDLFDGWDAKDWERFTRAWLSDAK